MSSESNFSFTTKIAGTDLFTVRGDNYDEFLQNLTLAGSVAGVSTLINHLDGTATTPVATTEAAIDLVQSTFPGSTVVDSGTGFNPVPPTPAPWDQPLAAPAAPARGCPHGEMIKRTGTSAKGEWRAFFCPTPKDTPGQCSPVFAKKGSPEWASF